MFRDKVRLLIMFLSTPYNVYWLQRGEALKCKWVSFGVNTSKICLAYVMLNTDLLAPQATL